MLQPGGFSFVTLIHEFGHGMGLAHPHDTGGGSSVMPGVNPLVIGDDGGKGTYGLNQGVYTMMSYNDGWEESPYGLAATNNEGYGWLGSLMAFDIAVIQDKYGVNEDWATGNDTYVLKDVNEWGVYIDAATGQPAQHDATNAATTRDGYYVGQSTSYSSIWDAGGIDEIKYVGTRNTTIDLRPATLQYEVGGGGFMSYAFGIYGGFTIANGVTIENASSGSGNDTLIGNAVDNHLNGGAGIDTTDGGAGNDWHIVDNLGDIVIERFGEGSDRVLATGSYRLTDGAWVEVVTAANQSATTAINLAGNSFGQIIIGNAGTNVLDGGGGIDSLWGLTGDDVYVANGAETIRELAGEGNDRVLVYANYTLNAGAEVELISAADQAGTAALRINGNELGNNIQANDGNNILNGGGGNDTIWGLAGGDVMNGGAGSDVMIGGAGSDGYWFTDVLGPSNVDTVIGCGSGDHLFLDDAVFAGLGLGTLAAGAFRTGTTAQDADDRILYDAATGALYFDADGNGAGAAIHFASLIGAPSLGAGDFTVI